ncbi:MAG: hypothetical protein H0U65_15370 [Rubrobacter sp.]|nr:hypothetical protein [Rubrobacter sp.]
MQTVDTIERSKAVFRRYVEEVWKDGGLTVADEVFAAKYLSHQSDGSVLERTPENIKEFVTECRSTFSEVEGEIVGESRVSFNEACEYSDGTKVLSAMTLDIRDGKILRPTSVEAWDE